MLDALLSAGPSSLGLTQDDFQQLGIMGPQALDTAGVDKVLDILTRTGLAEVDRIGPEFLVRPTPKARRQKVARAATPPPQATPPAAPRAPKSETTVPAPEVPKVEPEASDLVATAETSLPPSEPAVAPVPHEGPTAPAAPERGDHAVPDPSKPSPELQARLARLREAEESLEERETEVNLALEQTKVTRANLEARQRELDEREETLDDLAEKLSEQSRALGAVVAQITATQEDLQKVLDRPRRGAKGAVSERSGR